MQKVDEQGMWCEENNLILNISKTKETILDFHKTGTTPPLLYGWRGSVEMVSCFRYLRIHVTNNLKKAHQRLYFLRKLKRLAEHQNPQFLLQVCGGEHSKLLHCCVVRWLHNGRETCTAVGG